MIDVAIDANVFFDLTAQENEESLGLAADWIQDEIRLCVTQELFNDIDRNRDGDARSKAKTNIQDFHTLEASPTDFQRFSNLLRPLFPNLDNEQTASDFRHLAWAAAAQVDVFVTRDRGVLNRADQIRELIGLSVVRPAELVTQIDELIRQAEYQPALLAGTKSVTKKRLNEVNESLVTAILRQGESRRAVENELNRFLAQPNQFECHAIWHHDNSLLACYVVERESRKIRVHLIRLGRHRLSKTASRSILTSLVQDAVASSHSIVEIADANLCRDLQAACEELGFLPTDRGFTKVVLKGLMTTTDVNLKLAQCGIPEFQQIRDLCRENLSPDAASRIEHLLWPVKITDVEIACFIVPIRPDFALELFDSELAKQTLYGADVELALNTESVYYRSARQIIVQCPGRILWYISDKGQLDGIKAIRGCSSVAEVCLGKPSSLFRRFQRLGVYDWDHVFRTAKQDINRDIMAIRFHDTEQLTKIDWDTFLPILRQHGVDANLESPVQIPATAFHAIYSLGLNSP